MADVKISALPAAATLDGTETLPAVQSAANVKATAEQLRAYGDTKPIALAPPSLTGSSATPSLAITQTWNTTGTPTAFKLDVTNTASNAASLLMDLRVGAASYFKVGLNGDVTINSTLTSAVTGAGYYITNAAAAAGFYGRSNTASLKFGTGDDVVLTRDAANTLALRNSTNAQAFNVYNTYTDASNYERGRFAYVSNVLEIGHQAAGTGTASRSTAIFGGGASNKIVLGQFQQDFQLSGVSEFAISASGISTTSGNYIGFSSSTSASSGADTAFARHAAGVVKVTNGSTGAGVLQTPALTVATLPAAATAGAGARSFVTDANATTFLSTVAGGGANPVPVISDGTNWLIG